MGSGYSGNTADGRTAEEAITKLVERIGAGNYGFCWGDALTWRQTSPTIWETNLVARDNNGVHQRAAIEQLYSPTGLTFYRARFGGLLCI